MRYHSPKSFENGATGFSCDEKRPRHLAYVKQCPVEYFDMQVAAYACGMSEDGLTVQALFRRFGKRVRGYLMMQETGPVFVPHPDYVKYLK
jgi:hypothetical protein